MIGENDIIILDVSKMVHEDIEDFKIFCREKGLRWHWVDEFKQ